MLLFTASDLASITSHIHNWMLFFLWFCLFREREREAYFQRFITVRKWEARGAGAAMHTYVTQGTVRIVVNWELYTTNVTVSRFPLIVAMWEFELNVMNILIFQEKPQDPCLCTWYIWNVSTFKCRFVIYQNRVNLTFVGHMWALGFHTATSDFHLAHNYCLLNVSSLIISYTWKHKVTHLVWAPAASLVISEFLKVPRKT